MLKFLKTQFLLSKKTLHSPLCLLLFLFTFSFFSYGSESSEESSDSNANSGGLTKVLGILHSQTGIRDGNCEAAEVGSINDDNNVSCDFQCDVSWESTGSTLSLGQYLTIDSIRTVVTKVIANGKKTCANCENPTKYMFGSPGALVAFLNQASGVATAAAFTGGISKICEDVGKVQGVLSMLNGAAGMKCGTQGGRCLSRHTACIQLIEQCKGRVKEVKVAKAKTAKLIAVNALTDLQSQLEANKSKCEFAKKAGDHMVSVAGSLGLQAVASHMCAKDKGSGRQQTDVCSETNHPEYSSLQCRCQREDEDVSQEECCAEGKNSHLAMCNPCIRDANSLECQCRNPIMAESLEACKGVQDPGKTPAIEADSEIDITPGEDLEFSFSEDGGQEGQGVFGNPNVSPLSKDNSPQGGSAGSPVYSRGSPGGSGGGPGGVGGFSSGGGSGEEGEVAEAPESDDTGSSDKYSNLLQGLTGKDGSAGGLYGGGGGYNPSNSGGSSADKPFDLSQFLPKQGEAARDVAGEAQGTTTTVRDENIFEISSRGAHRYCQENQVECAPQQAK